MGFEDFFENNHSRSDKGWKKSHYNNHNEHRESNKPQYPYQGRVGQLDWKKIIAKISENKKLKTVVILSAIVILAIVILLVIALLPLLGKIFTLITQLDLQGLIDYITGFLDKLLKG